ncbi:TPA: phage tail protein [Aeromonas dhakensis]|nr:phage tail protein [Aeromonas dhakensis]
MANFFAILTNQGAAKLANATALGVPLRLTTMAVGDGNGQAVTPTPSATKLVNEKRRAQLNTLFADPLNASQLVAEQIIPETVGGWWIRELGLYDDTGTLIAVANCPDTYKPLLSEGSGRTQVIRMVLIVSSTSAVELKIDPAVVLATRKYVDDALKAHKESRDHPDASETEKGFSRFATQTEVNETVAANRKADAVVTVQKLWGWVKQATETVLGMMKVATQSQTNAGTADDVVITPKKLLSGFTINLGATGYIILPAWLGGVIMQWGVLNTETAGKAIVTFPVAYPSACVNVTIGETTANDQGGNMWASQGANRTGFTGIVRNSGGSPVSDGAYYFSIGY